MQSIKESYSPLEGEPRSSSSCVTVGMPLLLEAPSLSGITPSEGLSGEIGI